ncbi:MAG: hypothetical protein Q4D04_11335, partial [Clostridia bacterium]|nr:hypothetical protein [Clostridia bacterium]
MIRCQCGRARAVRRAVALWRQSALDDGARAMMIVPAQLTLQAERDYLDKLGLKGSFDIQVYSPQRLFNGIFARAGETGLARLDDKGRVMLAHMASLECEKELKWYQSAVSKPSFAGKLAAQIASFKQAELSPDDVLSMSTGGDMALDKKLEDLSKLYAAYERLLEGRFMDAEDEIREAIARMGDAGFIDGCRALVYGFDLLSPSINRLIVGLDGHAASVDVCIVSEENPNARDYQAFIPVNRTIDMLISYARSNGVVCHTESLTEPPRPKEGGIAFLERELCCLPPRRCEGRVTDVQTAVLPNPQAEAEFVACVIRRLCRMKGWRYRDFAIALADDGEYARDALSRAFTRAGIPLFLASGRPADRHGLARALLSAIRAASRGWRAADMIDYLRSGFSGLDDNECDIIVNYAISTNMRGKRWQNPIDDEKLESIRQRAVKPISDMAKAVKDAPDTKGRLEALFMFLESIQAVKTLEKQRQALEQSHMREWAMEGGQVWNRIIEALDQMYEIMPARGVRLSTIYDCLSRSLAQSDVKALPQSADAVESGAVEHLRGKPVKALIITGAVETAEARGEGLLDETDAARLGDGAKKLM